MGHARLRVWLDIENPPQVQYLLPFKAALEGIGAEVVLTARDYGSTVQMLTSSGTAPSVFGVRVGRGQLRKGAATVARARDLLRFFATHGRPDVLLAASRSSALAGWRMRIPTFLIGDYEHSSTIVSRLTGSMLLYPDVIEREVLLRRGLRPHQLIPFRGLKEDLSFGRLDVDAVEPYDLRCKAQAVRVLFRPPSETSHYYREASSKLARATLAYLAREGALVVFSPREPKQVGLLDRLSFAHDPVILSAPVPFVSLLKSVDAVVCAGGTMLREAAYLGIPSYSIFQSEIAAVDRWLERLGRAHLLRRPEDLARIELKPRPPLKRLDTNPNLLDEVVSIVTAEGLHAARSPAREAT
jgi:predicted glycosyltransferase